MAAKHPIARRIAASIGGQRSWACTCGMGDDPALPHRLDGRAPCWYVLGVGHCNCGAGNDRCDAAGSDPTCRRRQRRAFSARGGDAVVAKYGRAHMRRIRWRRELKGGG